MTPEGMPTPVRRMPSHVREAVEESIALSRTGARKVIGLHQQSNDASQMHTLLELLTAFQRIEGWVKTIKYEEREDE